MSQKWSEFQPIENNLAPSRDSFYVSQIILRGTSTKSKQNQSFGDVMFMTSPMFVITSYGSPLGICSWRSTNGECNFNRPSVGTCDRHRWRFSVWRAPSFAAAESHWITICAHRCYWTSITPYCLNVLNKPPCLVSHIVWCQHIVWMNFNLYCFAISWNPPKTGSSRLFKEFEEADKYI